MHSGSPLWDTPDNTLDGPKKANEFAEIFGCTNRTLTFESDKDSVLDCLSKIDAAELNAKSLEVNIFYLQKLVCAYDTRRQLVGKANKQRNHQLLQRLLLTIQQLSFPMLFMHNAALTFC